MYERLPPDGRASRSGVRGEEVPDPRELRAQAILQRRLRGEPEVALGARRLRGGVAHVAALAARVLDLDAARHLGDDVQCVPQRRGGAPADVVRLAELDVV